MSTGHDKSLLQQSLQQSAQKRRIQEDSRVSHHQSYQNSPSFTRKFKNSSFLNNNNTIGHNPVHHISSQIQHEEIAAQKQIEMEQLIAETENLVTDITKNQSTISRLSLQEKNLWLNEKQSQLRELASQFDINSYNSPLNLVNCCDQLLQKANKLLSSLSSPMRIRSKHGSMCSDTSDEEVQFIKEKIDRQINRLQENSQVRSREIASCYTSPMRLNSSFKKSSVQRISSLASPLNRPIRNYSMTNISNLPIQNDYQRQKAEELQNNEQEILATSLVNLKKSMLLKEDFEYQKRRQDELDKRNLDLKLKDQVYRNQDLEDQVKKKEQVIHQIDREMKYCQDDLLYNLEKMKDMEIKQSNLTRTELHLRDNNEALKQKTLKKKKKIQTLKLTLQSKNRDFIDLEDNLNSKVSHLQRVLNECQESLEQSQRTSHDLNEEILHLRSKLEIKDQQIDRLNEETEHLRQQNQRLVQKCELELQEKLDMQTQIKDYSKQLEETEFFNQQFETKFQKMRTQLELEKDEYKKQVEVLKKKKKQKMKKIQQFINEQDERIIKLETEKIQQETHFKIIQVEAVDYKKEIEVLKESFKQATNEIVLTKQSSQNFQTETERLQNLIASLESKIKILENGAFEDARIIQSCRQQLEQEESQNNELRNQNKQLEVNILDLEEKQNSEINSIERQVDQLINDINSSRALNEEYRIKDDGYRKQIASLNDLAEQYKEKYYKSKHTVKAYKQQLRNMDERFKYLETQKIIEQNEYEKVKICQKLQEQKENKLKVIDEIQGLIQTHKKVRLINN